MSVPTVGLCGCLCVTKCNWIQGVVLTDQGTHRRWWWGCLKDLLPGASDPFVGGGGGTSACLKSGDIARHTCRTYCEGCFFGDVTPSNNNGSDERWYLFTKLHGVTSHTISILIGTYSIILSIHIYSLLSPFALFSSTASCSLFSFQVGR